MRRISRVLFICVWFSLLIGCRAPTSSAPAAEGTDATQESGSATLTVFAAASLTEAFGEIGQQYEQKYGTKVAFNFAGSQQLVQQLAQGAAADVFASASAREMDNAITAGAVISGTQQIFVRNRLVVILPKANRAQITTLHDLVRPGLKLIVAAEQVPVGAYTRQALARMSDDPAFGADFQARVEANVVSQEENVKSVVAKVSLDEADAGVVYASDVTPAISGTIATVAIPDTFNQIAAYPIAPTSEPPAGREQAAQFIGFVLSREGQIMLGRYNFLVDPGK